MEKLTAAQPARASDGLKKNLTLSWILSKVRKLWMDELSAARALEGLKNNFLTLSWVLSRERKSWLEMLWAG